MQVIWQEVNPLWSFGHVSMVDIGNVCSGQPEMLQGIGEITFKNNN
jgi:hypothetical protein